MDHTAGRADVPAEEAVTVTVAGDHIARLDSLAESLRAAGMTVDRVLDAVGVITGTLPAGRREAVEALPGVGAVETQTEYRLAPPDSDVQ